MESHYVSNKRFPNPSPQGVDSPGTNISFDSSDDVREPKSLDYSSLSTTRVG